MTQVIYVILIFLFHIKTYNADDELETNHNPQNDIHFRKLPTKTPLTMASSDLVPIDMGLRASVRVSPCRR